MNNLLEKLHLHRLRQWYVLVGLGIIGAAAIYLVSLWLWNVRHTPVAAVATFSKALSAGDTGKVTSMLNEDRPVPQWEAQGFVKTYRNQSRLRHLISTFNPATSKFGKTRWSPETGYSSALSIVKHNIAGFKYYDFHIQPVSYRLSGPKGVTFAVGGQSVRASGTLLPGQYNITATVKTVIGSVSDTEPVDTSGGFTIQRSFAFLHDMLTLRFPFVNHRTADVFFQPQKVWYRHA